MACHQSFFCMIVGAGQDEIRSSYKRLALRWHPDKHNNSEESTKVRCKLTKYHILMINNTHLVIDSCELFMVWLKFCLSKIHEAHTTLVRSSSQTLLFLYGQLEALFHLSLHYFIFFQKFQEVSSAYKRLTSEDSDDVSLTVVSSCIFNS